jgi:hypothetical protein
MLLGDGMIEVLQNMNFAVKSSVVTNLLDAHGVPYRDCCVKWTSAPLTSPKQRDSTRPWWSAVEAPNCRRGFAVGRNAPTAFVRPCPRSQP